MSEERSASPQQALTRLHALVGRLRGPGGCPWDREQNHDTLLQYTIEEVYELVEAVEQADDAAIQEELGDLLFHVFLYSQVAEDEGRFNLADVTLDVIEKMVLRHPHVFGEKQLDHAEQVVQAWDTLKSKEKEARSKKRGKKGKENISHGPASVFDGLSRKMPALMWAYKMQQKMAKTGFDWAELDDVMDKLREEIGEFEEAVQQNDSQGMEEELGDLLFMLVNIGRHLKINPEVALRRTVHKCEGRFRHIETRLHEQGRSPKEVDLEEMERYWVEKKNLQKQEGLNSES